VPPYYPPPAACSPKYRSPCGHLGFFCLAIFPLNRTGSNLSVAAKFSWFNPLVDLDEQTLLGRMGHIGMAGGLISWQQRQNMAYHRIMGQAAASA